MTVTGKIPQAPIVQTWQSGRGEPIAILPYSVAELQRDYGLAFAVSEDDLGPFQVAVVLLQPDQRAMIVDYDDDDDEDDGPTVLVDARDDF